MSKTELSQDFILGIDVSVVLSLEESGVSSADAQGIEKDLFQNPRENGINYIRVRVWNDLMDAQGNAYGGGNNDIQAAREIGRRPAPQGMKSWADGTTPISGQTRAQAPKAWEGMKIKDKAQVVYLFTLDSLRYRGKRAQISGWYSWAMRPTALVLLAMGFVGTDTGLLDKFGVQEIYDDYRTNNDKVLVAGDARRGPSLVIWQSVKEEMFRNC